MRRPHLEFLSCMQQMRLIQALARPANEGSLEARNKLLNLVSSPQQAKLLDRWRIPDNELSFTCLGAISIS